MTVVIADAVGCAAIWVPLYSGWATYSSAFPLRLLSSLSLSFAPATFLAAFMLTTMGLDTFRYGRWRKAAPAHSNGNVYRTNAASRANPSSGCWMFKDTWSWRSILRRSVVATVVAGVAALITSPIVELLFGLPWVLIFVAYTVTVVSILVSAHVGYITSFVELTIDPGGLRITRIGARDIGTATSAGVDAIRTIAGLVLIPYEETLWLNQPLRETKRGRYVVLRPIGRAPLVLEEIRRTRRRDA